LAQQVTRAYLQFAKGMPMLQNDALAMTQALSDAQTSLLKCMKGSYSDGIPSPPTQAIVDTSVKAWEAWKLFDEEVRRGLDLKEFTPRSIDQVATQSFKVLDNMNLLEICA
jgi:hypothetical protein